MANVGALVIDLRANGGGRPDTAATLIAYLMDSGSETPGDHRHAAGTDARGQDASLPSPSDGSAQRAPGPRPHQRANVLGGRVRMTSRRSSASRRGETSGGSANPAASCPCPTGWRSSPTGRVSNAITHANWEGVGVKPGNRGQRGRRLAAVAALPEAEKRTRIKWVRDQLPTAASTSKNSQLPTPKTPTPNFQISNWASRVLRRR